MVEGWPGAMGHKGVVKRKGWGQLTWDTHSLVSIHRADCLCTFHCSWGLPQAPEREDIPLLDILISLSSAFFLYSPSRAQLPPPPPSASIILNHQGVKYNKASYRSICRLFLKGVLQVNIPLACEKWAYLQQMTLMNLRSRPSIILFQLASPAKHGFPGEICLAEGRVSLIRFPPTAPASLPRCPFIRPPRSEMSFFRKPGNSSQSSNVSPCWSKSESKLISPSRSTYWMWQMGNGLNLDLWDGFNPCFTTS